MQLLKIESLQDEEKFQENLQTQDQHYGVLRVCLCHLRRQKRAWGSESAHAHMNSSRLSHRPTFSCHAAARSNACSSNCDRATAFVSPKEDNGACLHMNTSTHQA